MSEKIGGAALCIITKIAKFLSSVIDIERYKCYNIV